MPLGDYLNNSSLITGVNAEGSSVDVSKLITQNLNGIFGVPYQFLPSVDRRLKSGSTYDTSEMGRKYAEKIVSRIPLLFLTPGRQVFMEEATKNQKQNVLGGLLDPNSWAFEFLDGYKGRYYSFNFAYAEYFNYVNTMCRAVAANLGFKNKKISIAGNRPQTLTNFDWRHAVNEQFSHLWDSAENIVFYIDGLNSVSESFSNGTTQSSLSSTINGYSDTVKEIKFLLGEDSIAGKLAEHAGELTSSISSSLSGLGSKLAGGVLEGIMKHGVSSVLSGGKIIFPEIWQDSTFDKSYSIDIKLRSPDHDSLSIYLNIIVPYIHLLAMCLPIGIDEDPNAYTSPFLVKASSKGKFSVEMGLITNMSATKGAECQWNDDGLPTQMDISLEIKDLYSTLFMSKRRSGIIPDSYLIAKNTGMMDYLAVMSGMDLHMPELARRSKMAWTLTKADILNTPARIWSRFDQAITNFMYDVYKKI